MSKNVIILVIGVLVMLAGLFLSQSIRSQSDESTSGETDSEVGANSAEESVALPEDNGADINTSTSEEITEEPSGTLDPEEDSAEELETQSESTITDPTEPNEVVIDMIGINYEFDVKQIRVKKGDVVTINLRSDEGFHDWVVDEFGAATERINEGGFTSVTFVADEVGTFQYYCSVGKHRQLGMVGYLTVEE